MRRRQFVAKTSAAVVGTALSAGRVLGANERVNVALIGCGTRGRLLANLVKQTPGAAVTALCDVYDQQVAQARESAKEAFEGNEPEATALLGRQYRKPWTLV